MLKNESGQSLFEVLAATAVIGVALVALVSLSTRSVSTASFARNKNQASRYTQEAYEWIRLEREKSWSDFVDNATDSGQVWCLSDLTWAIMGSCSSAENIDSTIFKREAILTNLDPANNDEVEVDIITSWEDGTGIHSSRSTTRLTDWKSL